MAASYLKLGIACLLPVMASVLFYILKIKTNLGRLNYMLRQSIVGVVFGIIAVIGTEWGIPLEGAMVNCRDAAPLCAGLLFGGPAGIIAGIIGGVERWIAVSWGVGSFTRVACSVSTIFAGFYAAFLRKYMFDNKKPSWTLSLAIGAVMEVLHLTMVFVTNMDAIEKAASVVRVCTVPMVLANSLSVMLATMVIGLLLHEKIGFKKERLQISQNIQRWMLVCVMIAFGVVTTFMYFLQNNVSIDQAQTLLQVNARDVASDIEDASSKNLMELTRTVVEDLWNMSHADTEALQLIADEYDIAEINYVNRRGIINASTVPGNIGFDMNSGEQAAEFMVLVNGNKMEYVQKYGPISKDGTVYRKYAAKVFMEGFIQVGYDAQHFQKDISTMVHDLTANRHVGRDGFVLIVNDGGTLVSHPEGFDYTAYVGSGISERLGSIEEDVMFEAKFGEADSYCVAIHTEGFWILTVYPKAEAVRTQQMVMYVNTFLMVMVFAVLFGVIYFLIKRNVVNSIRKVNSGLAQITAGNLDVSVDVRSSEEFASLSDDINQTVTTLKRYIDEASARIDAELHFAKSIQLAALPAIFPPFPGRTDLDIYATMDTAKEVGGDFYDFYLTGQNDLNVLIADVSGKGIPAALFMMKAKTQLKSLAEQGMPLEEVFTQSNNALCEGNEADMFVTAWQARIDLTTGIMRFVNAGHNPPLLKKADGEFCYLKSRAGLVLAAAEGMPYKESELQLEPGDTLYLYTDGVTEANNRELELYGEDRLADLLNSYQFDSMQEICKCVGNDLVSFAAGAEQADDITMVAFRYLGPKA